MEEKIINIRFETAKQLFLELLYNRDLTEEPEIKRAMREAIGRTPNPPIHVELSPILITEKGQIIFPDYGDVELKLSYLGKTLYLFYLICPEGVPISKLGAYRTVLYHIYERVAMQKDINAPMIKRVVDRLFDTSNNRVYELCSVIRSKLEKVVPEDALPYYIITGQRGRNYNIGVGRSLVKIKNRQLIDIERLLLEIFGEEDTEVCPILGYRDVNC